MGESDAGFRLSQRGVRTRAQPIGFLMGQAVDNPDVISLAAGLVDDESLPAGEIGNLVSEMLTDLSAARTALQYGTTPGLLELRGTLLEHITTLDGVTPEQINVTPDNVVISSGSQQLLFILSDILIDPGDIVITAWPSYFVYTGTLQSMGAEVRGVEMDEDGIIPSALETVLKRLAEAGNLPRVKIFYVQSYHQNPTGITLSAERRGEILATVRKYSDDHKILLLEDAAYRELTYRGDPPPSIKRYDEDNTQVALTQTFSKAFAPGVRTGYALLPTELVEPVLLQKGNHDFGSGNLCQHILLAAMRSGVYQRHLKELRQRYSAKRDAMLQSLREHLAGALGGKIRWTHPSGGLYVYLTFPESIETGQDSALFETAVEEGVLYVPGEFCFGPDPTRDIPRNTMRLCYGKVSIDEIREGVARLSQAVKITCGTKV